MLDSAESLIEIFESPDDFEPDEKDEAKSDLESELAVLHNLHLKIKDE